MNKVLFVFVNNSQNNNKFNRLSNMYTFNINSTFGLYKITQQKPRYLKTFNYINIIRLLLKS